MKVLLAGCYGHLGLAILKELLKQGHEVVGCDLKDRDDIKDLDKSKFIFKSIDVTKASSLEGIATGCEVVISTVGLTGASSTLTNYDIDYRGNVNLLNEAKRAEVKNFVYISVIKADEGSYAPMVHAKYLFEQDLKKSGLTYVIHRPTGYMYDIFKVFKKMTDKGEISLLGKKDYSCNVVKVDDFATFIVKTMKDENKLYNVGGKETYTYEEIAKMCIEASKKEVVLKRAPVFLFNILGSLPKMKKSGKGALIKFSKFTLTNDLVGDTIVGETSFKEFIKEKYEGENK